MTRCAADALIQSAAPPSAGARLPRRRPASISIAAPFFIERRGLAVMIGASDDRFPSSARRSVDGIMAMSATRRRRSWFMSSAPAWPTIALRSSGFVLLWAATSSLPYRGARAGAQDEAHGRLAQEGPGDASRHHLHRPQDPRRARMIPAAAISDMPMATMTVGTSPKTR